MPIWLRKFTIHKMNEHYDKENEAMKKASRPNSQTLSRPDIKNSAYSAKLKSS